MKDAEERKNPGTENTDVEKIKNEGHGGKGKEAKEKGERKGIEARKPTDKKEKGRERLLLSFFLFSLLSFLFSLCVLTKQSLINNIIINYKHKHKHNNCPPIHP